MSIENINVSGHGIKNNNVVDRWTSRKYEELACLFIEDSNQSENVKYLLEKYISQVIDGIKICMKELKIEKCKIIEFQDLQVMESAWHGKLEQQEIEWIWN